MTFAVDTHELTFNCIERALIHFFGRRVMRRRAAAGGLPEVAEEVSLSV
ncbi:hypothetical protein RZA67_14680 [Stenotrophomonas sp. C3(2023)]|nr:hypothetical protein [Stenotrophomonas sp. C3(2023)]MDV3469966.1 hypothetical protein [Stenotrophomonas sp. C3(2023)]